MALKDADEIEAQAKRLASEGRMGRAANLFVRGARRRRLASQMEEAGWDYFAAASLRKLAAEPHRLVAEAYEAASECFDASGNRPLLLLTLLRKAQTLAAMEASDEALAAARRAMDLASELEARDAYLHAVSIAWWASRENPETRERIAREALRSPLLQADPTATLRVEYFLLGADALGPHPEKVIEESHDYHTLALYCHEAGSASLAEGKTQEALRLFRKGKEASIASGDPLAYFVNVMGEIIACELTERRREAMRALLRGATSLRTVFGKVAEEHFFLLFRAFQTSWGEEEFDEVLQQVKQEVGITNEDIDGKAP